MTRVAVIQVEGHAKTWTVIGSDHLPITPVEEFLRLGRYAARTVQAYAHALHAYFDYLDLVGVGWDQIETLTFGGYLRWLRTGLLPSVTALGPQIPALKETSVASYSTAVLSFYRFQFDAHDVQAARKLYRQRPAAVAPQQHPNYRPRLLGLAKPRPVDVPIYRLDAWQRRPTPVLTPEQVALIMSACGRADYCEEPDDSDRQLTWTTTVDHSPWSTRFRRSAGHTPTCAGRERPGDRPPDAPPIPGDPGNLRPRPAGVDRQRRHKPWPPRWPSNRSRRTSCTFQ